MKKRSRFFIEVHLKFPANRGFIPAGTRRGSAKGMKGNLQNCAHFQLPFLKISKLLARSP